MNNNYEQLRSWFNKRFPERLKLGFGVEVVWQYTHVAGRSSWERAKRGIFVNHGNGKLGNPLPSNVLLYGNSSTKSLREEECKILGKPLTIADVMNALRDINDGNFLLGTDGTLWTNTTGGLVDTGICFDPPTLSHPDNDEACGKLLAVLTNKVI